MIINDLKLLLGKQLDYKGSICEVIDVLEDDPALVLQSLASQDKIQPDQYGEAHRRAPETFTVSVFDQNNQPKPLIIRMVNQAKLLHTQ